MTQCQRIMRHLNDYGSITSLEAIKDYGIMRLASRISDLRKRGIEIESVVISGRNRYDEPTYYKKYYLKEKEHGKFE